MIAEPDGVAVIDPGPDDASHVEAVIRLAGGPISRILLTHTHADHVGAAPALAARTGAPVLGWHAPWLSGFRPDRSLADGERVGSLTVLHTPGHASDHLCFARDDGTVFTGDHVMSWSTTVVSPPDGDMAAYLRSLRLLLARADTLYLGGHGPPLPDPSALVRGMLSHRLAREQAVLGALTARPLTPPQIVERLYVGLEPRLAEAAAGTVLAHLGKLAADGLVLLADGAWRRVQ
jgi:glyoxylase-like metal-dependent hydrolase (beta-lactamase superfamily II)